MKNKIKYILGLAAILLAGLFTVTATAQTNTALLPPAISQPVNTVVDYISANTNAPAATNWTIAPYGTKNGSSWGGGLAAVYYINPYVGTQIRAQYLPLPGASSVWLPNGTITLQSAYQPFGSHVPLTIRPMVELGAATDFSGNLMAIGGYGGEIDLYHKSGSATLQRISVFYGREKWQGASVSANPQQFGVAANLNLKPLASWVSGLFGH